MSDADKVVIFTLGCIYLVAFVSLLYVKFGIQKM